MPDEINRELGEISPEMAQIPREDPFKVPEGYFLALDASVKEKIKSASYRKNVIRNHFTGSATLKWMAASIAILILGSAYYYKAWKSFNPGNYTNTESYIIENFDETTITDYLTEISVNNNQNNEILDNSLESIDEEIIIEEF